MIKVVLSIISKRKNINFFTFRNVFKYFWNLKHLYKFLNVSEDYIDSKLNLLEMCMYRGYSKVYHLFDEYSVFYTGCALGNDNVVKKGIKKGFHKLNTYKTRIYTCHVSLFHTPYSPLERATLAGKLNIVKLLIKAIKTVEDSIILKSYIFACEFDKIDVVKYLDKCKIKVINSSTKKYALVNKDTPVFKYLIRKESNKDTKSVILQPFKNRGSDSVIYISFIVSYWW